MYHFVYDFCPYFLLRGIESVCLSFIMEMRIVLDRQMEMIVPFRAHEGTRQKTGLFRKLDRIGMRDEVGGRSVYWWVACRSCRCACQCVTMRGAFLLGKQKCYAEQVTWEKTEKVHLYIILCRLVTKGRT